ncbi:MAG: Mu transposase C-terminal domain-containing protein [Emcibacter sp.]|nr:Mu transposase C-terminal domain-containing protein [Emcibacter sp.]
MALNSSFPPSSDWLSAAELSALALPGVGKRRDGVLQKAQKEGWRSRLMPGAGDMYYEFHIRSLPREALEAYAERLLGPDVIAPLKQVKDSFTSGLKAFQREVMEARAIILAEIDSLVESGIGRSNAIKHFVNLARLGRLSSTIIKHLPIANARSGYRNAINDFTRTISRSTLYLWLKEREERGIAALAPKTIFRSPYIPTWAPTVMKLYGQPQNPSLAYVMEILPDILPKSIKLPSYGQVSRFLKRLSTQTRHQGRMGQQKLKTLKAYIQRDVSELWPGAVYAADGHRFDAEVSHPRHGRPFRPEITTVIDVYSRKVVGWSVALDEDTWGVLDAARHAFETNGLPYIWYVDNGRGFNNKNWDDELTGFLARLGITKKNSLPYNSQARGVIERLHKSLWVRSAKSLASYIGFDMDREARQKQYKLSRQDIREYGKSSHIMSWSQFMEWVNTQVEAYNNRPHSLLPKIRDKLNFKLRHMTPEEAWAAGIKDKDAPLPLSQVQHKDITRPYVKRRTNRALVNLFGNRYFAPELEGYHGEDILVGYDIHDAKQVWVRDLDHRLICIAHFEGNKQSFFPVEVAQKAHQEKLARQLKLIDHKRDLIVTEQNLLQTNDIQETDSYGDVNNNTQNHNAISENKSNNDNAFSRPTFTDTTEWIRWIIRHPEEITHEDKSELQSLIHQRNFRLLLDMLEIPCSSIEVLIR